MKILDFAQVPESHENPGEVFSLGGEIL